MATINPLFLSPYQAHHNKTIPELLPTDVALLIFRKLSLRDLVNCSEASRGLNELASDDRIWKPTAQLLGLRVEQLPYDAEPAVTSGYKAAIGVRVLQLKACIAETDPVLDAQVKTAVGFVAEMLFGAKEESTLEEVDKELQLHKDLVRGMRAHLLLRRIGMSTFQKMEQYATVCEEKCGERGTWRIVAEEYVVEGNFEKAIEIINAHLNTVDKSSERNSLFYSMINHFSNAGDFQNAIAYLKKLRSYESWDRKEELCSYVISSCAMKKRNFAVVLEMLSQDLIPKSDRISNILNLTQVYMRECDYQKARDVVQQFAGEMEKNSN